jgi:hypothetical protein
MAVLPTLTLEWLPAEGPGTATGSWADISTYLQSGSTFTGRSYELERFNAGTATFVLGDTTRRFDPEYTSGAWFGNLVPMRQIRLIATYNAVAYPIWRGYVTDWGQVVPDASDETLTTTVTAKDAMGLFEMMGLPGSWFDLAVSLHPPTHWWRLNETEGTTAYDSGTTSTPYTGDYVNGATLNAATVVPYDGGGKGATFDDALLQYVNIPGAASEAAGDFTLEVWYVHPNPVNVADPEYMVIIGATNGLQTSLSLSTPGFLNGACAATGNVGTVADTYAGDDTPHQAVLTRSGTTLTLYVDGALEFTDASTATTALLTDNFTLGRGPTANIGGEITYFDGTIAHVLFWDGTVLSATDVENHYNAGFNAHSGEGTGELIDHVLDYKGFPTSLRDIDTGVSIVGAYELSASNVADFVQQMADTEAGQTYVSHEGKLTHRARSALWTEARSATSQATFGDKWSSATLNYVAEGFLLVRDEALIRNPVTSSRSGGLTYTATDVTYTTKYGERSWSAPVSFDIDDDTVVDRANVMLGRYKELGTRLENMRQIPARSPTLLYPQALGRLIGDQITVQRKPLNQGNQTELAQLIEAVSHQFTPHLWVTEWRGSPVDTTEYALYDDGVLYDDGTVYGF